jgi:hypothetical protein
MVVCFRLVGVKVAEKIIPLRGNLVSRKSLLSLGTQKFPATNQKFSISVQSTRRTASKNNWKYMRHFASSGGVLATFSSKARALAGQLGDLISEQRLPRDAQRDGTATVPPTRFLHTGMG